MSSYIYSKLHVMIQEERRQDLKNMFILLNGIPGALDILVAEFEQRIKSQGRQCLGCRYFLK